jgi:hypothetical protein
VKLLLPVARPATRKDWTQVAITVNVPARYRRGLLRPRHSASPRPAGPARGPAGGVPDGAEAARPRARPRAGPGCAPALTGTIVFRLPGAAHNSRPGVDGRPLFFHPSSLPTKSRLLSGPREKARARIARYDRLLAGRPDPSLAARKALLGVEVERINARQTHPQDQVARLAARWAVERALAAGCHTIALEERVSLAMRGRIAASIEQAADLEGLRVVTVLARGTSRFCSRYDSRVWHLTAQRAGRRRLGCLPLLRPRYGPGSPRGRERRFAVRSPPQRDGCVTRRPRRSSSRPAASRPGGEERRPGPPRSGLTQPRRLIEYGGAPAAPALRHPRSLGDTVGRSRNPRASRRRSGPRSPPPPGVRRTA